LVSRLQESFLLLRLLVSQRQLLILRLGIGLIFFDQIQLLKGNQKVSKEHRLINQKAFFPKVGSRNCFCFSWWLKISIKCNCSTSRSLWSILGWRDKVNFLNLQILTSSITSVLYIRSQVSHSLGFNKVANGLFLDNLLVCARSKMGITIESVWFTEKRWFCHQHKFTSIFLFLFAFDVKWKLYVLTCY
jgi:hypothetical protein